MQPIQIVRGTTLNIGVALFDQSGNPVELDTGDILRFGVKKQPDDTEYLIVKTTSTLVADNYVFALGPSDTASLDFARYFYDIGLQTGSDYYMVVECSYFDVTPNITAIVVE